jgi:hypothetical protein
MMWTMDRTNINITANDLDDANVTLLATVRTCIQQELQLRQNAATLERELQNCNFSSVDVSVV